MPFEGFNGDIPFMLAQPPSIMPAGKNIAPNPLSWAGIGAALARATGGDMYGSTLMGDLRGIGHSMMDHYRDNYGLPQPANPMDQKAPQANPITAPSRVPQIFNQAPPSTSPPGVTPPVPIVAPIPDMAQKLSAAAAMFKSTPGAWGLR